MNYLVFNAHKLSHEERCSRRSSNPLDSKTFASGSNCRARKVRRKGTSGTRRTGRDPRVKREDSRQVRVRTRTGAASRSGSTNDAQGRPVVVDATGRHGLGGVAVRRAPASFLTVATSIAISRRENRGKPLRANRRVGAAVFDALPVSNSSRVAVAACDRGRSVIASLATTTTSTHRHGASESRDSSVAPITPLRCAQV